MSRNWLYDALATPIDHIRRLAYMRRWAILAMLLVLMASKSWLNLGFPLYYCLAILAAYLVWNSAVLWRSRRDWPATALELFSHLLVDCGVLTWILYLTGGYTNPFVSLYLLFIAIGAISLSFTYTLALMSACVAAYLALHYFYVPLMPHHAHEHLMHIHLIGMGVSFVLIASLIAVFLNRFSQDLQRLAKKTFNDQERQHQSERAFALGLQAANTAHDISTPLGTISLSLAEILAQDNLDAETRRSVVLALEQSNICAEKINHLRRQIDENDAPPLSLPLKEFAHTIVNEWLTIRPEILLRSDYQLMNSSLKIRALPILKSALQNLLENAAKASLLNHSDAVYFSVIEDEDNLRFVIRDEGDGVHQHLAEDIKRFKRADSDDGWGMGLVLSNLAIEQLGGKLLVQNRDKQGAECCVSIPKSSLSVRPENTAERLNHAPALLSY